MGDAGWLHHFESDIFNDENAEIDEVDEEHEESLPSQEWITQRQQETDRLRAEIRRGRRQGRVATIAGQVEAWKIKIERVYFMSG